MPFFKTQYTMAISPDYFKENLVEEANTFEKQIDATLLKTKPSYGKSLTMEIPRGLTVTIWNILERRYLEAGWKEAKWNSCQREGSWLSFKY